MLKFKSYNFCSNCGKQNHKVSNCNDPTTSYGVLCYKDDKIVLVRRKYTLSYIGIIMGKYDINDLKTLTHIFARLTRNELINIISIMDFDNLRNMVGLENNSVSHRHEYENSKVKFSYIKNMKIIENIVYIIDDIFGENFKQYLKSDRPNSPEENKFNVSKETLYNIKKTISNKKIYDEPEWEIPKGKRFRKESNINVAVREFIEETDMNNFEVFKNVIPLEEDIVGINNVRYKYVYYIGSLNDYPEETNSSKKIKTDENIILDINESNDEQRLEISKVGLININDIENYLREYQVEKKKVIYKSYQIFNNYKTYFD